MENILCRKSIIKSGYRGTVLRGHAVDVTKLFIDHRRLLFAFWHVRSSEPLNLAVETAR